MERKVRSLVQGPELLPDLLRCFLVGSLRRIKLWKRLGLSKKQYLTEKPWKHAGLPRQKYESIMSVVPQEYLDELRYEMMADVLVEKMFGEP